MDELTMDEFEQLKFRALTDAELSEYSKGDYISIIDGGRYCVIIYKAEKLALYIDNHPNIVGFWVVNTIENVNIDSLNTK